MHWSDALRRASARYQVMLSSVVAVRCAGVDSFRRTVVNPKALQRRALAQGRSGIEKRERAASARATSMSPTSQRSTKRFSDAEQAAVRERAKEQKAAAGRGAGVKETAKATR